MEGGGLLLLLPSPASLASRKFATLRFNLPEVDLE